MGTIYKPAKRVIRTSVTHYHYAMAPKFVFLGTTEDRTRDLHISRPAPIVFAATRLRLSVTIGGIPLLFPNSPFSLD